MNNRDVSQVSAEGVPTEPSMTRCTRSASPGATGKSSALLRREEILVQISHKSSLPGRCQDPNQKIVAMGNAFSDIECEDVTEGRTDSIFSASINVFTEKRQ